MDTERERAYLQPRGHKQNNPKESKRKQEKESTKEKVKVDQEQEPRQTERIKGGALFRGHG